MVGLVNLIRQGVGLLLFQNKKNAIAALVIPFCLLLTCCEKHSVKYGKSFLCPSKIGKIDAGFLIPLSATDIVYVFQDTGFGYGVEWKCRVKENAFLSFAKKKGFKFTEKQPDNWNVFFRFYGRFDMPKIYYYYSDGYPKTLIGFEILYDRDTQIMYGKYNSM